MKRKCTAGERLKKQLNHLSVPNESCPFVSNNHPPICQQPPMTSCLKCDEYLDGLCDLIPWDEEKMTDAQRRVLELRKRRDKLYFVQDLLYDEIHTVSDELDIALSELKQEEGR